MTKVLFTLETMESGGVEKRRLLVIKSLINKGFHFELICTFKKDNELSKEIEDLGVKIHVLNKAFLPWDMNVLYKIVKIIKAYNPDIIHGGVFEGCAMASIAGRIAKVPYRIIEETSDPSNRKKRADYLMKFYGFLSNKVIGISPAAYQYLIERAKIPKNKVQLINNGVKTPRDVSFFEVNELKEKLNISSNDFIIGTVGRMINDNEKRFSDLIRVIKLLNNKNIPAKLLMVGDGTEIENYKNLTRELEIEDKIIYAGYNYDVDLYYKVMDVFSLVSASEGFGLVLAEAMLSYLPVVATRVGGMKSIVKENETGYLVDVGDIHQMTIYFEKLYKNIELRAYFGELGYKRALRKYSDKIYTKQLESLYNNAINQVT